MMTGQDVASHLRRTFGDEASVQVADADILRWINAGQREIVIRNDVLKQTATANLVSGQNEYVFSNVPVLKIVTLHVNNRPVDNMTFTLAEEYILKNDPDRAAVGTPVLWYKWGDSIYFWPQPDSNVTNGIKVYFIAKPQDLMTLSDPISLPDEYFNRIVEYVMAQAYELDENEAGHNMKLSQFADNLNLTNGHSDNPQHEHYPFITVLEDDFDGWYV